MRCIMSLKKNFQDSRIPGACFKQREKEKILTVKIQAPEEEILRYLKSKVISRENHYTGPVLEAVAEDSYRRLIAPAIERRFAAN